MSIIERAMRKLNGARERQKGSAIEEQANIVRHPTIRQAPKQQGNTTQTAAPPAKPVMPLAVQAHQQRPASGGAQRVRRREHPVANLQVEGLEALDYRASQVAEELRRIKRPLLANAYGKGVIRVERGNMIMLTSSVPGEGKSRMSLNLAHSMALERDHSVLLVDTDVAKAQTSRMYGLEQVPGLIDILLKDQQSIEDVIFATDTRNISIIPAGRRHSQATELVGSREMERIAIELGEQDPNRIVIFDCPPLLATNEPQLLVRLVGQVVLVVEAGRTPQHIVKEAISMLDPTKAIGLVLNKSRESFGGDYYGYSYGGYYGRYHGEERHQLDDDIRS